MTSEVTVGALFAGYGGLDLAVEQALASFGLVARVAWLSEYEPPTEKNPRPLQGAARILSHRFPGVPNLGDVTAIDWSSVPPVYLMTGGSPCQDVSQAGGRRGMRAGTRSGLWASMVEGIATLRPQLVVWENVRGVLSAEADSGLEFCAGCMGGGDDGAVLRALGRVLGDLADVGYDAGWCGLRAADVGAPHGRFRVFVVAWRRDAAPDAGGEAVGLGAGLRAGVAGRFGRGRLDDDAVPAGRGPSALTPPDLLPTPSATDGNGARSAEQVAARRTASGGAPRKLNDTVAIELPTPTVGESKGARRFSADGEAQLGQRTNPSLSDLPALLGTPTASMWKGATRGDVAAGAPSARLEAQVELFPTPRATDGTKGGPNQRGSSGDLMLPSAVQLLPTPTVQHTARNRTSGRQPGAVFAVGDTLGDVVYLDAFGKYAAAIERWERLLGRPAPDPTRPDGKDGARRLSPLFVEWMMGLPEGWVTDPQVWDGVAESAARNAQLKALGNGVVPQQAAAAIRYLLTVRASALAA